ncbi:MAG: peptide deformylase [Candidatus Liptonbacteria bacterium RIFCSPLOWO2_01_FULL_56_20]|uniref:Peptide deformylase n=1 Tax=Candidatus Liptonbacteria bacterium RIFCSPLOWO2_01_FULL_56_20 TaxID=1798652 RepID=A0A1G2CJZ3_9BACT|nr:MAG: Peptide deformylase [Parcubacteria group bacterium GW2011_GWB1_56_8]OGZ01723.1 MAG: peptide deformylase [Candidatus Liptonbacteria bacterium RIFCSPLOWO2_01_FULL_56_20]
MGEKILTVHEVKDEKFLRRKAAAFDFAKFRRAEIGALIARMKRTMRRANGVGLSANQIGLDAAMFVAEVPDGQGGRKFYAIFNPRIEKIVPEQVVKEEGCLSVPRAYGEVSRHERITISGLDRNGKPIKVKAWGLLARVFQHEIDHLNGKLFIDRAKQVRTVPVAEALARREKSARQ